MFWYHMRWKAMHCCKIVESINMQVHNGYVESFCYSHRQVQHPSNHGPTLYGLLLSDSGFRGRKVTRKKSLTPQCKYF